VPFSDPLGSGGVRQLVDEERVASRRKRSNGSRSVERDTHYRTEDLTVLLESRVGNSTRSIRDNTAVRHIKRDVLAETNDSLTPVTSDHVGCREQRSVVGPEPFLTWVRV